MNTRRLEALQHLQSKQGVSCVALMPGANLRYFTGLTTHLSERPTVAFVPADGPLGVVLPELEAPAARPHLPPDARLFTYTDEGGHEHAFYRAAEVLRIEGQPLAVEYLAMRLLEARRIEQAFPGSPLLATEPWLPELRMVKDETEVADMRRAVEMAEAEQDPQRRVPLQALGDPPPGQEQERPEGGARPAEKFPAQPKKYHPSQRREERCGRYPQQVKGPAGISRPLPPPLEPRPGHQPGVDPVGQQPQERSSRGLLVVEVTPVEGVVAGVGAVAVDGEGAVVHHGHHQVEPRQHPPTRSREEVAEGAPQPEEEEGLKEAVGTRGRAGMQRLGCAGGRGGGCGCTLAGRPVGRQPGTGNLGRRATCGFSL